MARLVNLSVFRFLLEMSRSEVWMVVVFVPSEAYCSITPVDSLDIGIVPWSPRYFECSVLSWKFCSKEDFDIHFSDYCPRP
ncbi:hypothetical protein [Halomicrococcus sp. SG-WS-1]|uniref:hypothetical protein n=1 Tax=Halomicrococcus sp. SG-WS-1 TaxID=3439057 RepID=UPI003F7A5C79